MNSNLILLVISLISITSYGHSNSSKASIIVSPASHEEDHPGHVIQLARHTSRLLDQYAYSLRPDELRLINQKLKGIQQAIYGYHQPDPTPPAQPLPPPPPSRYVIAGDIEKVAFNFTVTELLDLHNKCVDFVASKKLTQVGAISISVNYSESMHLSAADLWSGANQVCNQIAEVARAAGVPTRAGVTVLTGKIQQTEFKIVGADLPELSNQCIKFLDDKGIGIADEIIVSVNFSKEQYLSTSDWWDNQYQICQQILNRSNN